VAHAGWDVLVAGTLWTCTALWVEYDLRIASARADSLDRPHSWRQVVARLFSVCCTVSAGVYLLRITLPYLHESLARGLANVVQVPEALAIVAGFSVFSAGLAARALLPQPTGGEANGRHLGRMRWVLGTLFGLGALVAGALLIMQHLASAPIYHDAQGTFARIVNTAKDVQTYLTNQNAIPAVVWRLLRLDFLVAAGCLSWVAWEAARLLCTRPSPSISSLDAVASRPGLFLRFLCSWLGLTVVCLMALPVFFIAGLVLFHIRANAADLLASARWYW
jgi:hypothetical protein